MPCISDGICLPTAILQSCSAALQQASHNQRLCISAGVCRTHELLKEFGGHRIIYTGKTQACLQPPVMVMVMVVVMMVLMMMVMVMVTR